MLYLFKSGNGVEIAWNGRLNKPSVESRIRQLDTRFSLFGFIRTRGLG
jgi:hypothetical protein